MKRLVISLIKFYKKTISPMTPKRCRYIPTCSQYAIEAIEKYGVLKGGVISALRILRCNPLFKGGFDPLK